MPRLETAAAFVATLYAESRSSPRAWRRAEAIARRAGVDVAQLGPVLADTVAAGLVDRRADDADLVILTDKGRAIASGQAT